MAQDKNKERGGVAGGSSGEEAPGLNTSRPDPTSVAANLSDGKVTNDDTISKRSVAATFEDADAAQRAVKALVDQGFDAAHIVQSAVDGGVLVLVNAGPRAIDALAVLERAGGNTSPNEADRPPAP